LAQLKQIAVVVLFLISLLSSLFLAWVIYTQVEVIRLYALRWRASGVAPEVEPAAEQPIDSKDAPAIEAGSETRENLENK
jgi:hypothetical protein